MFSSLHTEATLILMEELERAGVTGYVGKVNMDRNGLPGVLEETTEASMRDTLRWLDRCQDTCRIHPILTPRFTPSCTDKLMEFLGRLAAERGLRYNPTSRKTGRKYSGSGSCTRTVSNIGRLCQIRPLE